MVNSKKKIIKPNNKIISQKSSKKKIFNHYSKRIMKGGTQDVKQILKTIINIIKDYENNKSKTLSNLFGNDNPANFIKELYDLNLVSMNIVKPAPAGTAAVAPVAAPVAAPDGFQWVDRKKNSIHVNISNVSSIIEKGDIMSYISSTDGRTKRYICIESFRFSEKGPPTGIFFYYYRYSDSNKKWIWDGNGSKMFGIPVSREITPSNYNDYIDLNLKKETLNKKDAEATAKAAAKESF